MNDLAVKIYYILKHPIKYCLYSVKSRDKLIIYQYINYLINFD